MICAMDNVLRISSLCQYDVKNVLAVVVSDPHHHPKNKSGLAPEKSSDFQFITLLVHSI